MGTRVRNNVHARSRTVTCFRLVKMAHGSVLAIVSALQTMSGTVVDEGDDGTILRPKALARFIASHGNVRGLANLKGTTAIQVTNDAQQTVHFNIGIFQGLRLVEYDSGARVGVPSFKLEVANASSWYTVKQTKPRWYEVDLLLVKCPCCEHKTLNPAKFVHPIPKLYSLTAPLAKSSS